MVKEVEAPFLKVHIKWPDGNKRYTIMVPAAAPLSDLHEIAKMYLQVLAPLRSKYTLVHGEQDQLVPITSQTVGASGITAVRIVLKEQPSSDANDLAQPTPDAAAAQTANNAPTQPTQTDGHQATQTILDTVLEQARREHGDRLRELRAAYDFKVQQACEYLKFTEETLTKRYRNRTWPEPPQHRLEFELEDARQRGFAQIQQELGEYRTRQFQRVAASIQEHAVNHTESRLGKRTLNEGSFGTAKKTKHTPARTVASSISSPSTMCAIASSSTSIASPQPGPETLVEATSSPQAPHTEVRTENAAAKVSIIEKQVDGRYRKQVWSYLEASLEASSLAACSEGSIFQTIVHKGLLLMTGCVHRASPRRNPYVAALYRKQYQVTLADTYLPDLVFVLTKPSWVHPRVWRIFCILATFTQWQLRTPERFRTAERFVVRATDPETSSVGPTVRTPEYFVQGPPEEPQNDSKRKVTMEECLGDQYGPLMAAANDLLRETTAPPPALESSDSTGAPLLLRISLPNKQHTTTPST